jgi:hypothetical protein
MYRFRARAAHAAVTAPALCTGGSGFVDAPQAALLAASVTTLTRARTPVVVRGKDLIHARRQGTPSRALLAERILPGLGWLPGQGERREGGAAFFLLVPLRLRLLLFLVAAHLTLGHGVPPALVCPPCAGGGGIEAPPAHGFKRRLASVDSAVGRMLPTSRLHFEYFS